MKVLKYLRLKTKVSYFIHHLVVLFWLVVTVSRITCIFVELSDLRRVNCCVTFLLRSDFSVPKPPKSAWSNKQSPDQQQSTLETVYFGTRTVLGVWPLSVSGTVLSLSLSLLLVNHNYVTDVKNLFFLFIGAHQ